MCSVNNEAVLKALVKVKDDELTFTKALQIAQLTEEAAKLVQSTSPYPSSVNKVQTSHLAMKLQFEMFPMCPSATSKLVLK